MPRMALADLRPSNVVPPLQTGELNYDSEQDPAYLVATLFDIALGWVVVKSEHQP